MFGKRRHPLGNDFGKALKSFVHLELKRAALVPQPCDGLQNRPGAPLSIIISGAPYGERPVQKVPLEHRSRTSLGSCSIDPGVQKGDHAGPEAPKRSAATSKRKCPPLFGRPKMRYSGGPNTEQVENLIVVPPCIELAARARRIKREISPKKANELKDANINAEPSIR